ncbi:HipA N-terminal domain-containing protein [Candidatus Margulisiibacteriota bacterium]
MNKAKVYVNGIYAGLLEELHKYKEYRLTYDNSYQGNPVSLTMPVRIEPYTFDRFPPFFEGLLPEGIQLDSLLRQRKIDKDDLFRQLITVGRDMVGAVTVEEAE